jgi:pimeloyl-ACP methyl ester carboxylesterase
MTEPFEIVERGSGAPLVLVPSIHGRWEYSRAIVESLARFYRVITFSLCDERTGRSGQQPIDVFADQVESALDRLGLARAAIVGVSFGGLVALRFAATRPHRTVALAMVSAPGPRWHLLPRHDLYTRVPWLFAPVFVVESPFRLGHEVLVALPGWRERGKHLAELMRTIVTAPVSFSRMAARARLIASYDRVADCARVTAPTLIVHGDDVLDHVTGSGGTAEYEQLIAGARLVRMPRTGHLGSVTHPDECADLVHRFLVDAKKDSRDSSAA